MSHLDGIIARIDPPLGVEMVNPERFLSDPGADLVERMVVIRGQKVILDSDLAALYGVPTKRLNEQVRRNPERFPPDFMFLLSSQEWDSLRSQIATKTGRAPFRKFLPYVFTEHGALMASGLLNSPGAIEVSIFIVRALGGESHPGLPFGLNQETP